LARGDSSNKTVVHKFPKKNVDISYGDTILRKNNYIIIGKIDWKVDFIFDNNKHKRIKSKGDTLYDNYDKFCRFIILGDHSYKDRLRVFKRYSVIHNFSEFKIDSIYNGTLSKPDFKSNPEWKHFKTVITEEAKGKPNFAGHYWICGWGCGTECQYFVIVDCITGKIFDVLDEISKTQDVISNLWECYPDSKMLIINNNSLVKGKYYDLLGDYLRCGNTEVYIWDNEIFKRIE
jgi:hypothetical protein